MERERSQAGFIQNGGHEAFSVLSANCCGVMLLCDVGDNGLCLNVLVKFNQVH